MNLRLRPGRRAEPQQIIEQLHVFRHDQRSAASPFGNRQPFSREGSSHDLRPFPLPQQCGSRRSRSVSEMRDSGTRGLRGRNQRAAPRKNMWILLENCGQLRRCEYLRHPNQRLPERSLAATHCDEPEFAPTPRTSGPTGAGREGRAEPRRQKTIRTCDDPRRGESGGRPHDPTRGRSRTGVSTVANDP